MPGVLASPAGTQERDTVSDHPNVSSVLPPGDGCLVLRSSLPAKSLGGQTATFEVGPVLTALSTSHELIATLHSSLATLIASRIADPDIDEPRALPRAVFSSGPRWDATARRLQKAGKGARD